MNKIYFIIISLKHKCFKIRQRKVCIFYEVCKHHIRYSLIKIRCALCWEYLGWKTCCYFRCTLDLFYLIWGLELSGSPIPQAFLFQWWMNGISYLKSVYQHPRIITSNCSSPPEFCFDQLVEKALRFGTTWSLSNIFLLTKARRKNK